MRSQPQKREPPSGNSSASSSRSYEDDDDEPPTTTRSPPPSLFAYPSYENEEEDAEEEEEEDDDDDEDDANLLEILIETLTGTTFQVRVSPWETGAGLKALLQRTQGLPATHQHILIGQTELSDESPLIDQGVQDGSTLRLVLAMKGGPINSRRAPSFDDSVWKEFSDYMEINREELWDSEPGRPVTLLVLREGDAVNLYRVVENDDGTFSPLNESWSSNRSGSGKTDRSDKESLLEETLRHQQKMAELTSKMEALKLRKQEKKKKKKSTSSPKVKASAANKARKLRTSFSLTPRSKRNSISNENSTTPRTKNSLSAGRVLERTPLISPRTPDLGLKTPERLVRTASKTPRLPPVVNNGRVNTGRPYSRPATQETTNDIKRVSISRSSRILQELPVKTQPRHVEFSYHPKLESIRQRDRKISLHPLKEDSSSSPKPNSSEQDINIQKDSRALVPDQEGVSVMDDNSTNSRDAWSGRDAPIPLYMDPGIRRRKSRFRTRLNHSYNAESFRSPRDIEDRPKTSPEFLEHRVNSAGASSTMSERIQLRGPDERLKELISILNSSRSNSRLSEVASFNPVLPLQRTSQEQTKRKPQNHNPFHSGRTSLSTSFTSLRAANSPSPPFTPRGTGSLRNSTSQLDILKDLVRSQIPVSRRSTPEKGKKVIRRPGSGQFKATSTPRAPPIVSPRTPKRKPKKIRPRCQQCSKKIGVATTHTCRCGLLFCAQHRYAETHNCSYDYKTTGKKMIEIANPLVVPPKLPKI